MLTDVVLMPEDGVIDEMVGVAAKAAATMLMTRTEKNTESRTVAGNGRQLMDRKPDLVVAEKFRTRLSA